MKSKNTVLFVLAVLIIAILGMTASVGLNVGSVKVPSAVSQIKQGLDLKGGVYVVYEARTDAGGEELAKIIDQTIEVFRKRVDGMGLTEPVITKEGEKRIRIELPGVQDAQQAIETIGKTAQLRFLKPDGSVVVTGAEVHNAQVVFDNQTNQPQISLEFDTEGAKKFAEATAELAPLKQPIAIVLDEAVISSPVVEDTIANGKAVIRGNFTTESASQLAGLIRAGALPVNFEEVRSSTKTATLGVEALNKSVKGAIIGIALVMLFMLIYYRLPGLVADIALTAYMVIFIYIYLMMKATLTLPGIAALILSVGMAVDANVIIFERIKEELRTGKSIRVSIDSGFQKALSTILDSQITTFIAGIVLYNFGTGPIKGFAITLMVGIVASVFTAVFVTKFLMKALVAAGDVKKISYFGVRATDEFESSVDKKFNLQVVQKKKIWFSGSVAIILIGLVMMFARGFNLGIDFTGGTLVEINTHKYVAVEEVRALTDGFDKSATITYAGEDKEIVQIRTTTSMENAQRVELFDKFKEKYALENGDLVNSEQFGAAVGKEIQRSAVLSVMIATIFMLIYITFRFQLSYGLAAIIALVHDVLIVLSFYAIFRVPVNSPFVAAMLTVVGYSINDTIVVFDRIRENMKRAKRNAYAEVAEMSVNQTIARSINTSFTTLLAIAALYVVGVDSIKEFTLPLLAGIGVGTFSSIFIASPIWVMIKGKKSTI